MLYRIRDIVETGTSTSDVGELVMIEAGEDILCLAEQAVRQEDAQQAEALVHNLHKQNSHCLDGYARIGGVYREMRQWEQAYTFMSKDYTAGRMSVGWQLRYAEVQAEVGHMEAAQQTVASVYAADSSATDGYARLGAVWMRRHDWSRACALMEKDDRQMRLSALWKLHYAYALAQSAKFSAALNMVASAYDMDEKVLDGYCRIGWDLGDAGDWKRSYDIMMRDYALMRISPKQLLNLAVCATYSGGDANAIRFIDKAYALSSDLKDGYARLGWARFKNGGKLLGFIGLASKDHENARLTPDWQVKLAYSYRRIGNIAVAMSLLDSALAKVPGHEAALRERGICLTRKTEWNAAKDIFLSCWKASHAKGRYVDLINAAYASGDHRIMMQTALEMAESCCATFRVGYWKKVSHTLLHTTSASSDDVLIQQLSCYASEANSPPLEWWFGLYLYYFRSARVALAFRVKDLAARLAAQRSPSYPMLPWMQIGAFVDQGDWVTAAELLRVEMENHTSIYDRRELSANAALLQFMKGDRSDLYFAQRMQPGNIGQRRADEYFASIIAGKTVAVVGSANTGVLSGEEIDSYDIVIRTNYLGKKIDTDLARRIGKRTDVSYYPTSYAMQHLDEIQAISRTDKIRASVIHYGNDICDYLREREPTCLTRSHTAFFPFVFGGIMLAAQRIVTDILPFAPRKIKVFHCDFYLGNLVYNSQHPHFTRYKERFPIEALASHDMLRNVRYARTLFAKAEAVEVDSPLRAVLDLTDEDFIDALVDRHFRN